MFVLHWTYTYVSAATQRALKKRVASRSDGFLRVALVLGHAHEQGPRRTEYGA